MAPLGLALPLDRGGGCGPRPRYRRQRKCCQGSLHPPPLCPSLGVFPGAHATPRAPRRVLVVKAKAEAPLPTPTSTGEAQPKGQVWGRLRRRVEGVGKRRQDEEVVLPKERKGVAVVEVADSSMPRVLSSASSSRLRPPSPGLAALALIFFTLGGVAVAAVFAVGGRFINAPEYSESARARARRLQNMMLNNNSDSPNWMNWQSAFTPARGGETVEWLNAALRKVWRVYMKQIELWIQRKLQRAIDGAVLRRKIKQRKESEENGELSLFNLNRVKLVELKLDFQPPVIRAIERRSESRRDSEIGAIANLRYTGGLTALFMIEVSISLPEVDSNPYGVGEDFAEWQQGLWRSYMSQPMEDEENENKSMTALAPLSLNRPWQIRIPVQVYDLDIESDLWIRATLAPLAPYVGKLSLAFVDSPAVGVQLAPYKRAQLMRIPVVQSFLTKLITEDLPNLMILPRKLNFEIPPSLAAVAGAAVGQDIVKKAILNAVLKKEEEEEREVPAGKLKETMDNLMARGKTTFFQKQKKPPQEEDRNNQTANKKEEKKKKKRRLLSRRDDSNDDEDGDRESDESEEKVQVAAADDDDLSNDADNDATEHLKELVKPLTQGGITLPQVFQGELLVTLNSARGLMAWTGMPGIIISSPFCTLELGSQTDSSRKYQKKPTNRAPYSSTTGYPYSVGRRGTQYEDKSSSLAEPVWNQEFQFLVQDPSKDELVIKVKDSQFIGTTDIGYSTLRVADLEIGVQTPVWLSLQPPINAPGITTRGFTTGEVFIEATYRSFADEDIDGQKLKSSVDEGEDEGEEIKDIKSAAAASVKAGITSSMTARALAITKAASVRASLALKRFNQDNKKTVSAEIVRDDEGDQSDVIAEVVVSESKVKKMMEALQERLAKEEITSENRAARWIARSDKPWFQLVSFLLAVVILLLVLIAYRLDLAITDYFPHS